MKIKKYYLLLTLFIVSCPLAAAVYPDDDIILRTLSVCSKSTPCLIAESVVFFPVFPWFQYPVDVQATASQLKRFNRVSADLDLMMSKENNSYSGYKGSLTVSRKWFGFDIDYNTLNNGEEDQKTFGTHFLVHFMPRFHIRPGLAFGWKYVKTNNNSGGGVELSFFNYKITFNRRFHLYLVNY
ncbi:MAG: hypothetical protein JXA66_02650, partial [Oligoflexia bacterium]|nr:hypothetical protein [Oligoflexia bacterium]